MLAKRHGRRTVGAIMVVALASRFWRLGCPKIYHEVATRLGIDTMLGGSGDDVYYVDGKYRQFPEKDHEDDEQHRKHGKGNEGLGNGYDAPPPGHERNWNDYQGTSPGHPGSRENQGRHRGIGNYQREKQGGQEQHGCHFEWGQNKLDRPLHSISGHDARSRSDKQHLQLITDTVMEKADQGYDIR